MKREAPIGSNNTSGSSPFPVAGFRPPWFPVFDARSLELEHIDKGDYTAEEFEGCLVELRRVNRWLGDTRALRRSLLKEVESSGLANFSVLDVGAGSGELLRVIAAWAEQRGKIARLVGLELNARSATAIRDESQAVPAIAALRGNALKLPFPDGAFQYGINSLFTHHFGDDQIVAILRELARVASERIFVIDLHRHPVAYYFYTTVGRLFLHNRLLREDGALSILRSFQPDELLKLAQRAELRNVTVEHAFPYRLVLAADGAQLSLPA
jgi:SAM-dependent methyltransferase